TIQKRRIGTDQRVAQHDAAVSCRRAGSELTLDHRDVMPAFRKPDPGRQTGDSGADGEDIRVRRQRLRWKRARRRPRRRSECSRGQMCDQPIERDAHKSEAPRLSFASAAAVSRARLSSVMRRSARNTISTTMAGTTNTARPPMPNAARAFGPAQAIKPRIDADQITALRRFSELNKSGGTFA